MRQRVVSPQARRGRNHRWRRPRAGRAHAAAYVHRVGEEVVARRYRRAARLRARYADPRRRRHRASRHRGCANCSRPCSAPLLRQLPMPPRPAHVAAKSSTQCRRGLSRSRGPRRSPRRGPHSPGCHRRPWSRTPENTREGSACRRCQAQAQQARPRRSEGRSGAPLASLDAPSRALGRGGV